MARTVKCRLQGDQSYWSKKYEKHALMLVGKKEIHGAESGSIIVSDGTTKQ